MAKGARTVPSAGSYARRVVAVNLTELPGWASALLQNARIARLGLLDQDDHPRVLPVTFAVVEGQIWSAVDDKPKTRAGDQLARVRFLRRNPRAAFTVDHYSDEWSELAWVQILGEVSVVEAEDAPVALASLESKYEQYRESRPAGPLLALAPQRSLFWRAGG